MINGHKGGNVIDFLVAFGNMTYPEAVKWSLEQQGHQFEEWRQSTGLAENRTAERQAFVLPEANGNNKRIFAYLIKRRKLSYATVDYFVRQGLMYESREHDSSSLVSLGMVEEAPLVYGNSAYE